VLDIGVGSGKYGVLCREYLDQWVGGSLERRCRIDGVEAHEPYLGPLHRAVYDELIIGDAREVVPKLDGHWDLAMMIDVFEHLTPDDGRALVEALAQKATSVLVSVPYRDIEQGATHENEFERHRAHYDAAKLHAIGFTQVWRIYESWLAIRSPQRVRLKAMMVRYALSALLPALPLPSR
jgi:hypothetical protein